MGDPVSLVGAPHRGSALTVRELPPGPGVLIGETVKGLRPTLAGRPLRTVISAQ